MPIVVDVDHAITVAVIFDKGVAARLHRMQLPRHIGECPGPDKGKGLVRGGGRPGDTDFVGVGPHRFVWLDAALGSSREKNLGNLNLFDIACLIQHGVCFIR